MPAVQPAQAVDRCQDLVAPNERPRVVTAIGEQLLTTLVDQVLLVALDTASGALPSPEPRQEPPTAYFTYVSAVNTVFQQLLHRMQRRIVPLANDAVTSRNALGERLSEVTLQLERKIHAGLSRLLESACKWCGRILETEQKKTDFHSDAPTAADASSPTRACQLVTRYVAAHIEHASQHLDHKNLATYRSAFGMRLYQVIEDHWKRFTIDSGLGAMQLKLDAHQYADCIRTYFKGHTDLMEHFELLEDVRRHRSAAARRVGCVCTDRPLNGPS